MKTLDHSFRHSSLPAILRHPLWGGLTGTFLGGLLKYGASSIIYFSSLLIMANGPTSDDLNWFVLVNNVSSGVCLFLLTWAIAQWSKHRLRAVWLPYLILNGCVVIGLPLLNKTIFALMATKSLLDAEFNRNNAPGFTYLLAALLIANILFYLLGEGKQVMQRVSEQEVQLLNLEQLKNRAELAALQARVNPHFLYNALNSIASLVHDEALQAEEMTLNLSKLFSYTTGRDQDLFASLDHELAMVYTYLQIEKVRFRERLTFKIDVAEPNLKTIRLPKFILLPLVENAVTNGIAHRARAGEIQVQVYRKEALICLRVCDNGPDFSDVAINGPALVGIQNRLKLIYGSGAKVEIQNFPIKQVLISIGGISL